MDDGCGFYFSLVCVHMCAVVCTCVCLRERESSSSIHLFHSTQRLKDKRERQESVWDAQTGLYVKSARGPTAEEVGEFVSNIFLRGRCFTSPSSVDTWHDFSAPLPLPRPTPNRFSIENHRTLLLLSNKPPQVVPNLKGTGRNKLD